ncbi:MAG: DUF5711 family protein [Anaerobutyricum sp.]|nr:DUF5711 family protein [Anaerobutyricum sp.]
MAKQVYNFEVFTNKKEQLKKIRRKQKQAQWAKRIFFGVIALVLLIVLIVLHNSRCDYYEYIEETKTENSNEVSYESFGEGYIKYSENGIEYQKKFGVSEWNIPVSFSNPFLVKSKSYLLLADRGGNKLMLLNVNGKIGELTLKYPVIQADISDQGIVEVILEGEKTNFLQLYDREGNLIADMKSSVDETGYPMTAAISPEGTKLAVSYFSIAGMTSKTTVAFYDFSGQLKNNDVNFMGGFDYEDFMIPKLSFVDGDTLAAFGESATYYYNISDEPKIEKEITFEENIESVFVGEKYIGYVLDHSNQPEEGRYRLLLYSRNGSKKLDMTLDMDYETIEIRGNEIYAFQDNTCTIINTSGKILFQGELEGSSIQTIMKAGGWRTYHVIFRDKIVRMRLRFWEKNSAQKETRESS